MCVRPTYEEMMAHICGLGVFTNTHKTTGTLNQPSLLQITSWMMFTRTIIILILALHCSICEISLEATN